MEDTEENNISSRSPSNDLSSPEESKNDGFGLCSLFRFATTLDYFLVISAFIFALLQGISSSLSSVVLKQLTDVLIKGERKWINNTFDAENFSSEGSQIVVFYYLCGAFSFSVAFFSMFCWHFYCERLVNKISIHYFAVLVRQNWAWFDEQGTGDLTTRMSDGLERVRDGSGHRVGAIIAHLTTSVAGLSIAFYFSVKLTVVMLCCSPIFLGPVALSMIGIKRLAPKEMKSYLDAASVADEVIGGIRTVQSFNGQDKEIQRYTGHLKSGMKYGIQKAFLSPVTPAFVNFTLYCSMAVLFLYGTHLVIKGEVSPGTTFAVFWAVSGAIYNISLAAPHFPAVVSCRSAAAPIFEIIDRINPIDGLSAEGKIIKNLQGNVKVENLWFKYSTRRDVQVLKGVNFHVNCGENIALVGHSGCGKSTLASLLLRFYDVDEGLISIDDVNINQLNVFHLRNIVGIVNQEPQMFADTVENNLRLGSEDLTDKELIEFCRQANALEFISLLPDGFKTLIGSGGVQLSGGQKQRLAIARALARRPAILILDEATSALDTESESLVQEALENAKKGRTTITIAHRLSTIRNCDRIYVLDSGSVVEVGNHEELVANEGVYAQMVKTQNLKNENNDLEDENSVSSGMKKKEKISKRLSAAFSQTQDIVDPPYKESPDEIKEAAGILDILKYAKPEWSSLFPGIFFAAVRGLNNPIAAILYGRMFTLLSTGSDEEKIVASEVNSMFLSFLGIFSGLATMSSGYFIGKSGEKITQRMRMELFTNILRQDGEYFDRPEHATGRLTTRLSTDAPNIRAAIDHRLADIFQGQSAIFCGLGIALYYNPQLSLLSMVSVVTLVVFQVVCTRYLKEKGKKDAVEAEKTSRLAIEAIEQYRTVQCLTAEKQFAEKFEDEMKMIHKRNISRSVFHSISAALLVSYTFINFAICYTYGVHLVVQRSCSPFTIFQTIEALNSFSSSLSALASYLPEYTRARVSASLLFRMLAEEPKIDNNLDVGKNVVLEGDITFENVFFAYPVSGRSMVLNGLSLEIQKGKTTALVGASGSGKSTTVQLLERFYDPIDGNVMFDNENCRELNLKFLRSQMAVVDQQPTLFNISIRDNIAYGLDTITENEIIEAARLANAHEFITNMPDGYETIVGEGGSKLSGGQKQRIAIARAIVRRPKILLLDEATSALDAESERLVQQALEKAKTGRTCVIIAHRLSTVKDADLIAVMDEGKISEQGTHQQLMSIGGAYANFVQKSSL